MILAALLLLCAAGKVVEKGDVLLVDDVGFLDIVAETRVVLAEFNAPWCGHCKKIAPEYEKAAKRLKPEGVKSLVIDGSTQRHIATAYGVLGYPTLFAIVDGKAMEFTGERKADRIVKWVRAKAAQQSKEIFTTQEIDALLAKTSPVVLLLTEGNSNEKTVYESAIRPLNGTFLVTESKEVAEFYKVTGTKLVLLKRNEELRVDFSGEFTESAVTEFIQRHSVPWLLTFSAKTSKQVFYPNSTRLFFFRQEAETDKFKEVLSELAEKLQGKPTVVVADLTADLNSRLAELLGVNPHAQPFLMLYEKSGPQVKKHIYSGEKTVSDILSFLQSSASLPAYFKTEDPPKDSQEGGVRVLVGKTFSEVAMDSGKTVLVNFYAPWCGHCYEFVKEYEKVAKHFKARSNVVVAKIDAMMNELEDHVITTYPQIKLFPASNKTAVLYDGERKSADIISFVETHLGKK